MTARRRFAVAAVVCAGALGASAAPASAWVERYSFDDIAAGDASATIGAYTSRGMTMDAGCGYFRVGTPSPFGAHDGTQAVIVGDVNPCTAPAHYLGFGNTPRTVQMWVRSVGNPRAIRTADYAGVDVTTNLSASAYTRIQLVKPAGQVFHVIEVSSATSGPFVVDDIAVSDQAPAAPPATVFDSGPAATTTSTSASIAFHNTDPGPTFTCSLDGAAATPCTSPWTRSGLGAGAHTLAVRATGLFGMQESAARTRSWTVTPPPSPTPTPVPGATPGPGATPTPFAAPACTLAGPDSDHDGITDPCDLVGEPGTVPPTSGKTTNVKVTSGTVFIKLPTAGAARATAQPLLATRSAMAAPAPAPGNGYVPLKGDATVPVGSTVDARAGSISITSATAASTGGKAAPTASARIAAAIFQIRQARAKRNASGSRRKLPPNPTSLLLRTPQGGALQCSQNHSGVIRAISAVVPKGSFQFVGAAATVSTTTRSATLRAVDRCDGTLVEVGSGVAKVTPLHTKRRRSVTVRSGRGYLVKGDFLAIEGRKGI